MPTDASLANMRSTFWSWFLKAHEDLSTDENGEVQANWSTLRCPGENGVVLFVVALKWWFDLAEEEILDEDWVMAIRAVYCLMTALLEDARCAASTLSPRAILLISVPSSACPGGGIDDTVKSAAASSPGPVATMASTSTSAPMSRGSRQKPNPRNTTSQQSPALSPTSNTDLDPAVSASRVSRTRTPRTPASVGVPKAKRGRVPKKV